MEKASIFSKKWFRNIVKGMSLSTMAFAFQACYGAPKDFGYDIYVEGFVYNRSNNRPIKGIKVSTPDELQYTVTDEEGKFMMYLPPRENYVFDLEDIDGDESGSFVNQRDTIESSKVDQNQVNVKLYMYEKE